MKRQKKTSKKVRITLDLTEETYQRLGILESAADAGSKANLLRQALQVYELLFYRAKAGYQLTAVKEGTIPIEIEIPGVTPPKVPIASLRAQSE